VRLTWARAADACRCGDDCHGETRSRQGSDGVTTDVPPSPHILARDGTVKHPAMDLRDDSPKAPLHHPITMAGISATPAVTSSLSPSGATEAPPVPPMNPPQVQETHQATPSPESREIPETGVNACDPDGFSSRQSPAPDIQIAPLDFGTLTRDERGGTAVAETTVTIAQDDCGGSGSHDIQVRFSGEIPGFRPVLTTTTTASDAILLVQTSGDPGNASLTIARVPAGFTGTATVTLRFLATPDSTMEPGTHSMSIHVTAMTQS